MSKSRGHARHEEHEEHEEHVNHEAWVIPYADMLTLLMALFLVLFAVGRTDLEKFKKLAASMRHEFGNSSTEVVDLGGSGDNPTGDGGAGILTADVSPSVPAASTTTTISPADQALGEKEAAQAAANQEATSLEGVKESVQAAADAFGLGSSLNLTLDARGLVVTIVTDQVLFQAGDADLQPAGLSILDVVGQALLKVPNQISVEGHTDNRPISNARFADNWALSNARATSVVRYFIQQDGIPADRLSATGYADTKPIADNTTADGAARNRRVEVIVKAEVSLAPLQGADGTVTPVTPAAPVSPSGGTDPVTATTTPSGASASGDGSSAATGSTLADVASDPPVDGLDQVTGTTVGPVVPDLTPHLGPGLNTLPDGGTGG